MNSKPTDACRTQTPENMHEDCIYLVDEFCVNDQCPVWGDYCSKLFYQSYFEKIQHENLWGVKMIKVVLSLVALICALLCTIPFFINAEKKEFNRGICKCGNKLKHFDDDSQGGQGWYCNKCGRVMWISWINGYKERDKNENL